MRKLLVHSAGYPRPSTFRKDVDELRCGHSGPDGNLACKWSPSSLDFEALGRNSGGSEGVSSVAELRRFIERQPKASISELRVVGHANDTMFSFAGTILPDDVKFVEDACLGDLPTFRSQVKDFQRLADRFAKGGTITVMACETGGNGGSLLRFLSKSFLVPVKGFNFLTDYLKTSSDFDEMANTYPSHARFQPRGKFRYKPLDALFDANWQTDAWKVNPDAESKINSFAPSKAMRARKRGTHQVIDAGNLLWDMVHQFFREEAHLIAGTGYYPATELSLATEIQGNKKTIDVSQGFIENLASNTLHWRLRELRVALDLLQIGTARPIALQK